MWLWSNNFLKCSVYNNNVSQFWLKSGFEVTISLNFPYPHLCVCVCVQTYMCLCIFPSVCQCLCTCVCVYVCTYICVPVHVYVCGVTNIKFVSLACMPNEPKSANCKMVFISVCLSVCICLCVSVFVCVQYAKYKISILGIYAKWTKKCKI